MSTMFNILLRINQFLKKKPYDPQKVERARLAMMHDQECRGLTRFHDVVPDDNETNRFYH